MNVVYPRSERCINCRLCEVACIVEHSATRSAVAAYTVEGLSFNNVSAGAFADPAEAHEHGHRPSHSRCHVSTHGAEFVSTMCRHCEIPECVLACKNGALHKDPSGRVCVDEDKCVGCWMCLMACPFAAIRRNIERQNVPAVERNGINRHCDLCPGRDVPACVAVCPTGALVCEPSEEPDKEVAVCAT